MKVRDMRLCCFDDDRLGLVREGRVHDVTIVLDQLQPWRYPYPNDDALIAALPDLSDEIEAAAQGHGIALSSVQLRAPIANPGKIVAAPVNYAKHLQETIDDPATLAAIHVRKIQETGLFLKATSSLIGPGQPIKLRHPGRRTDHEVELAVIIGKPCNAVTAERAMEHVAGYAIGLDVTVRGSEERSLRKSIDSYTVLGPWLVTTDELTDATALALSLDVNGERRQQANTRDLILGIPELLVFASSFYSLMPGDILLTGTPEGAGPIMPGDTIDSHVEGIGTMRVAVEAA